MKPEESQQLGRIEQMVTDLHEDMPKLEKRIGSLERSRSYAKGAGAIAAAIGSTVAGVAWTIFK